MRILFVAPYVPSLIRVRPFNFIRELALRHEVTLLATDSARKLGDAENLRPFCRGVHLVPLRLPASLRSCAVAALRGEPLQSAFCRSPELDRRLSELLARDRYDLVHVEHLRAGYLGWHIPAWLPAVFDSVDCISLLLDRTLHSSHSLKQRVLATIELQRTRGYETRLLRRFDHTTVTADTDGQALLTLAPKANLSTVPNGVDLEYFRRMERARDPATLLFSGKMSYHANVTALLHFVHNIFPVIRKTRPDVRLCVVGNDPPAIVRALPADPSISVTGYLPDIRKQMDRATVAVCPVIVKAGIQNKVLEAMALELPVVATGAAMQGLAAEAGRDLLVADGPVEFADHVCRLLADPTLRQQIGGAGRRYVELHHRWDAATRRLEDVYAQALDARRQRAGGKVIACGAAI